MADPYVALFAHGTILRIAIDSVYTEIPYLGSITGPDETFDTIDVTTHSSPNAKREFISGLGDGGELTTTINWHADEDTHKELHAANQSREVVNFQLLWPGYTEDNLVDFQGLVTGLTRGSPIDAQVTRDLTIKITGDIEVSTE